MTRGRRIRALLAATLGAATVAVGPAIAGDGDLPACSKVVTTNCVTPGTSGDGWTFGTDETTDHDEDGQHGSPVTGQPLPRVITQRTYVPTCSGNDAGNGNDVLCGAAAFTCPVEGEVRMWVYTRRYDRVSRTPVTDWQRVTDPPSVCVGADEPGVDPVVLIPAIVERDFQRIVVRKGVAEVSPRPDTLINVPTRFETATTGSYDIPLTLLGHSVVVTATAESWTWHFGDGLSTTTTAKGTDGRVEHVYRTSGPREAYVVISWSGTFRIDGGAAQPITGRATTVGDPVALSVKQARSELVAD